MLVLDGKRTFIIGAYHLPTVNNPFRQLAEAGYNYVRVDASQQALDIAFQNQLMTWIVTDCITEEQKTQDSKRITELVRKFKSHPALLCWEIADEPAFTWNSSELRISPDLVVETYRIIKKEDSEHFVYTNHGPVNLVSTLQRYNSATDIIACDVYPVIPHGIKPIYGLFPDGLQGDLLNPYISQVGQYADKMRRVVNNSKPVFMVLQGFAWEMLNNESERNPAMIRYPTYEQLRFMAFDAIVHGAVGINYWGMSYTPQLSPFMNDLDKVTRELASMQDILAACKINLNINMEYHDLGHSVDIGIELLAKYANDKTYLIAVNSDKNPVKIRLSGLDDFSNATVSGENRTVAIQNGQFMDTYKPFDVHIYELYTYAD